MKSEQIITLLTVAVLSCLVAGCAGSPAAGDRNTGVVVTAIDMSQNCILSLVVTAVDGEKLGITDPSGRFEFEAGEHTISGYAGGNPASCSNFSTGVQRYQANHGGKLGEGSVTIDVEAGKEYNLGVDITSRDPDEWEMKVWKIKD